VLKHVGAGSVCDQRSTTDAAWRRSFINLPTNATLEIVILSSRHTHVRTNCMQSLSDAKPLVSQIRRSGGGTYKVGLVAKRRSSDVVRNRLIFEFVAELSRSESGFVP